MISYAEFMERLVKLNKDVNDFFVRIIRKKNVSITSIELLLLIKLNQEGQQTPKEIAKQGSELFNHLAFLLNSLEKKKIISIKSKTINTLSANVDINETGKKIIKVFQDIKIPEEITNDLHHLESYVNTLGAK